jgi:ERCC4-type nuclease
MSKSPEITIVIDTREQQPYGFDLPTVRRKLDVGDYSVDGYEHEIVVERKSFDDFIGTIIGSRERFGKELSKLSAYQKAIIVVEGNFDDITRPGSYVSGAHPNAILGFVTSLWAEWEIPVMFCSNRQMAVYFVKEYLRKWVEKRQAQQSLGRGS